VLEVVEQEQESPIAQAVGKSLADISVALLDAKGPSNGGQDEARIRELRKAGEENAVGEVVEELGRNLCGQARLARAAGPGQGDDPRLAPAEELRHFPNLALAADQRVRLERQVRGACLKSARRWEPAFQVRHDELEQPLSRNEVRQTVLPQIEHLGRVQGRFSEEVARGLREEDLSRVRCALNALRTPGGLPCVPVVRSDRFGRADPDPEAGDATRRTLNTDRGCNRVSRAGEGDEQGIAIPIQLEPTVLADDRSHELACRAVGFGQQECDDAGRLGRRWAMTHGRERIWGCELGILVQDLLFEPLQGGAGVEPELVAEHEARVLESLQGIRLPSRAVQRKHELRPQALTERVFGYELLELENDVVVVTEFELGLDLLFEDHQAELLESCCLLRSERLVAEVGERLASEERERFPELLNAGDATVCRLLHCKALEPPDIHRVLVCRPQDIARVLRFDALGSESLPQGRDMAVKCRLRSFGRSFPPQCFDAIVSGDDLVWVKQQQSEKRSVLPPRRGQIDAIGFHLEPAKQPKFHFVPIVSRLA
jgi:hypothetical protein